MGWNVKFNKQYLNKLEEKNIYIYTYIYFKGGKAF